MTVLFGHPSGNPNSHHAALAHFEAGWLETFCVAWMPSPQAIRLMSKVPLIRSNVSRFSRRYFPQLAEAPLVQGRTGELWRRTRRIFGQNDEYDSYKANDWLMQTMARECARPAVTAVHSYEDCSAEQFEEAKRLGKACIYDMPIGYYPAWERTQLKLATVYNDWLPADGLKINRHVRPAQKRREMELADLVLVPSSFVEKTILEFYPDKKLALAPYGVDFEFWKPDPKIAKSDGIRFIYAGQVSLRKGIPLLIEAWEKAALPNAELIVVGSWMLAETKRETLPQGIRYRPACSPTELRDLYRESDVFVFPSFFEGFGLVLLESMACGLAVIATDATAAPDVTTEACGQVIPVGDIDALVESLRWFSYNRDRLPAMGRAARVQAKQCNWDDYRASVRTAVASFV